MPRVSGVSGSMGERGVVDELGGERFVSCLRVLMRNKYGDLILLCTVMAAFAALLVVSTLG
jgi:hypothetical protein